ncbi:MAG: chemotaxis protein CheW [Acidobacteriota bacterium]
MEITTQTGKYLTFLTGGEGYGLPVLKVREIMKVMEITAIPQVPAYVRGVINLRGKVIPVIDLRLKFGMPPCDATDQTCIIVVEASASDRKAMMGLLVDGVSEVLNIQAAEIEQPPAFGDGVRTDYMQGVAKVKGTVKILLDIDRVLTGNEFDMLAA